MECLFCQKLDRPRTDRITILDRSLRLLNSDNKVKKSKCFSWRRFRNQKPILSLRQLSRICTELPPERVPDGRILGNYSRGQADAAKQIPEVLFRANRIKHRINGEV